ncbi:hypothetical protein Acr_09g0003270 [Actinidia rufa]|uniref:Uncharacterized protein n=1 Tax=Actinidia rufa TaxID=165716 RepID=A0A7J0F5H4_9ERIC|nr:hypothetical protein Acr_09g0003270 [Actinidia rufa]
MTDEVNQLPSSPMEGSHEESSLVTIHPSVEEKTNIMTLEELNALRDTYSFPSGVQIRLPDEGETITSTHPGEARNKKVLLGGYPSNVKGWKSKFFFVSGDEWEIPEKKSRKGAARVPRTWGIPDKHCNNPPRLFDDEMKVFEEIFQLVEESGRFSVPVLLDSKSFRRVFASPGSRASRTAGDHLPSGEALSSSSDVELRRLLPHIPDLTLLRWMGGKVLDPILDNYLNVPSSNPSSESCSDSSQPVELESDAMSKRVSFKKIGKKLGKAAARPAKKSKADDGSKGKGVVIGPEGKKKASSSSKASAAPTVILSRPGEETSAHLGAVPGPTPSILGSPSFAERLLRGVIPPADKEKVDKLTLDQTATKLFHVIGHEGRVASMETEVARLQKLAADFEQQLDESRAREQQALEELAKESAVEEFKSSSEFMVAVEDAASKYFGEGFDFCKVQLRRHHPDLAIDLEGTVVDQDLLVEQDEAAEERERENLGENKGDN